MPELPFLGEVPPQFNVIEIKAVREEKLSGIYKINSSSSQKTLLAGSLLFQTA